MVPASKTSSSTSTSTAPVPSSASCAKRSASSAATCEPTPPASPTTASVTGLARSSPVPRRVHHQPGRQQADGEEAANALDATRRAPTPSSPHPCAQRRPRRPVPPLAPRLHPHHRRLASRARRCRVTSHGLLRSPGSAVRSDGCSSRGLATAPRSRAPCSWHPRWCAQRSPSKTRRVHPRVLHRRRASRRTSSPGWRGHEALRAGRALRRHS